MTAPRVSARRAFLKGAAWGLVFCLPMLALTAVHSCTTPDNLPGGELGA